MILLLRKIIFIFISYHFISKKNLLFFDLNFKKIDFTNYHQIKTFIFKEKFMYYHLLGAIFIIAGITLSNKKEINYE